ncbi:MAG: hypothetical protein ACKV19_25725 [Verrucomicrobiales bacterium]
MPTILVASLLIIVFGPTHLVGWLAMIAVLAGNWVLHQRRVMAGDGAEQMASLILVAAFLTLIPGFPSEAHPIAVWFIGGQCVLAYTAAGIAKARSPAWRGGHAMTIIMGSEAHGHPWMAAFLNRYPKLAGHLTRCVIVFECSFLPLVLGPELIALAALGVGLLFHISCAALMKLNTFLWAFPGTYACVWLVGEWLSPFR